MLRQLGPNTQVFLGTSAILGFCYYTFFEMGDKNKPKQSVFDQSRYEPPGLTSLHGDALNYFVAHVFVYTDLSKSSECLTMLMLRKTRSFRTLKFYAERRRDSTLTVVRQRC